MSLYQRSGIWWADICKPGYKRIRASLGTRDKEVAQRILAEAEIKYIPEEEDTLAYPITKGWMVKILSRARERAKKKGVECSLTLGELKSLFDRAGGKCEVTGKKFSKGNEENLLFSPFSPSVDRIDSKKGYSVENCRIVCLATNLAMGNRGDHVIKELFHAYKKKYFLSF